MLLRAPETVNTYKTTTFRLRQYYTYHDIMGHHQTLTGDEESKKFDGEIIGSRRDFPHASLANLMLA